MVFLLVVFVVVYAFYPVPSYPIVGIVMIQFFVIPLIYCQIVSHSFTYGFYKKKV